MSRSRSSADAPFLRRAHTCGRQLHRVGLAPLELLDLLRQDRGPRDSHARLQHRQLVLQRTDSSSSEMAGMVMSRCTSSSTTVLAGERELAFGRALEELEHRVVAGQVLEARARDVALVEEDVGHLLPAVLLADVQGARLLGRDQRLDDGGQVEEAQVALELLVEGRGALRAARSSRLARTTHMSRAKTGSVCMRSMKTALSSVSTTARSGQRTVALRGEPVSSASSPTTSPSPR
jgi:hypothetical protein